MENSYSILYMEVRPDSWLLPSNKTQIEKSSTFGKSSAQCINSGLEIAAASGENKTGQRN